MCADKTLFIRLGSACGLHSPGGQLHQRWQQWTGLGLTLSCCGESKCELEAWPLGVVPSVPRAPAFPSLHHPHCPGVPSRTPGNLRTRGAAINSYTPCKSWAWRPAQAENIPLLAALYPLALTPLTSELLSAETVSAHFPQVRNRMILQ